MLEAYNGHFPVFDLGKFYEKKRYQYTVYTHFLDGEINVAVKRKLSNRPLTASFSSKMQFLSSKATTPGSNNDFPTAGNRKSGKAAKTMNTETRFMKIGQTRRLYNDPRRRKVTTIKTTLSEYKRVRTSAPQDLSLPIP